MSFDINQENKKNPFCCCEVYLWNKNIPMFSQLHNPEISVLMEINTFSKSRGSYTSLLVPISLVCAVQVRSRKLWKGIMWQASLHVVHGPDSQWHSVLGETVLTFNDRGKKPYPVLFHPSSEDEGEECTELLKRDPVKASILDSTQWCLLEDSQ